MIQSFADKSTAAIFQGLQVRRWPVELQVQARHRLVTIDRAKTLDDLHALPSARLEKLKGDRHAQWGIRVNRQWRICFSWHNGQAANVEMVDYH